MIKEINSIKFNYKGTEIIDEKLQEKIDDKWKELLNKSELFHESDILIVTNLKNKEKDFEIEIKESKFSHFMYAKITEEINIQTLFSGAYILTSDGYVVCNVSKYYIDNKLEEVINLVGGMSDYKDIINGYHNSSNIIKNQNNNIKTKKMTKNNNIYYINPNQINSSQNIPNLKQLKSKQQNQIYLEGDLNNFINNNNQPNIYISNLNKAKNNMNAFMENQNNNMYRTSHVEHMKNNRGLPRKSPIPVPKEFTPVKYLNNDNISNYSNNSNGESYHTANYQLLNNNYSISNLSQFSGYSNNSYNNQINFRGAMENGNIRAYFNNINSSLGKKRLNGSNSYNKYNINSNDKNNVIPQKT